MRSLVFLACLALSFAGVLPTTQAVAGYKLGPDDKLAIRVYEWPDLTGDFSVAADGSLSLPVIGTIPVTGLDVGALSRTIAENLQGKARLQQLPSVIVDLKQYRPFYILGDVQQPGQFPYRPGLTLLQAVGIAGGFFRLTDPGLLRLERDAITARGALRVLGFKRDQLTGRRARLLAELEDRKEIAYPPELAKRKGESGIAQLMQEEQIAFDSNRNALVEATASLRAQIGLYEKEIVSLGAQIDTEKQQLRAVQKELAEVQGLVTRGLAPTPRLTLLERNVAQIVGAQQNLETMIIRARQSISQAEQRINDLRGMRRKEITTELQKTTADLDDTRQQIATSEQLVVEAEETAPSATAARVRSPSRSARFVITRRVEGDMQDIEANGSAAVEPDDVIRVDNSPRDLSQDPARPTPNPSSLNSSAAPSPRVQ